MKEYKISLDGMTCRSCEKLIERVVEANGARLTGINAAEGSISISCDDETLPSLKERLAEKGFPERGEGRKRGEIRGVLDYISSIMTGKEDTRAENTLAKYSMITAFILIAIGMLASAQLRQSIPNLDRYIPLLAMAIVASISTTFAYFHVDSYRKNMSCQNGMMAGMTLGMTSGFMVGALIGATNGMFIGSVAGIAIGIILGGNLGRGCGVMGAMEGIMAGLMSGGMGAMASVMMINDNLIIFIYILFGICVVLSGGLSYMMHREAGSAGKLRADAAAYLTANLILCLAISGIMLLGPRSALVYP